MQSTLKFKNKRSTLGKISLFRLGQCLQLNGISSIKYRRDTKKVDVCKKIDSPLGRCELNVILTYSHHCMPLLRRT
jgi:hypothetical protein